MDVYCIFLAIVGKSPSSDDCLLNLMDGDNEMYIIPLYTDMAISEGAQLCVEMIFSNLFVNIIYVSTVYLRYVIYCQLVNNSYVLVLLKYS